jgi:hypothetical protein
MRRREDDDVVEGVEPATVKVVEDGLGLVWGERVDQDEL